MSEDAFEKIRKLKEELQNQLNKTGKEAFREKFEKFFGEHPEVLGVRWEQYTPYFNDGDPCHFSVQEPKLRVKDVEGGYGDGYSDRYDLPDDKKKVFESLGALNVFDEDICEAIFGDHAQITITRDGISVEESDHD